MITQTLTTARLVLRLPQERDFVACVGFWASDRSDLMDGRWTAAETRIEFDDLRAQWAKHGFSLLAVTFKGSENIIDLIGPFDPVTHPEPELGRSLWDAALEGRGIALEAAVASRDRFFAATSYRTAVSYTGPDNHRSHRLCERMGAAADDAAPCRYPPPVRIYRHYAQVAA